MRHLFPQSLLVACLAIAALEVHRVRSALTEGDADPIVVARLQRRLALLPTDLADGQYKGKTVVMSPEMVRMSGADTYSSLVYEGAGHQGFQLYVGGSIRNQENFHAPSYCMPAAGWEKLEETTVPLRGFAHAPAGARARRLFLQRGTDRMIVQYWFVAGSVVADHEWAIRWLRFLDILANRPLRPTLIVSVYAPVTGPVEETDRALGAFLDVLGPRLEPALQGDA